MSYRALFSVALLVLLCAGPGRSQTLAPERKLDDGATEAVRKKAIDLLESVVSQVSSLRSAENRARVGSNLGDLLWAHDEKRSRDLFAAVAEDIKIGFNEGDTDDETSEKTLLVFLKLRSDTLERIAKHDPASAIEFLRATPPPSTYRTQDAEKALELRLASQIAATNPVLALKLGRQSLAKGFSRELPAVLSRLRWKDKEASSKLTEAILDKLKTANLTQDEEALGIALYLTHSFQPPEIDEQDYRELLGVLLTGALASGCSEVDSDHAPYICVQIGSAFSMMDRYHGQRAAPLRRWARNEPMHSSPEMSPQVKEVIENGTIEELLTLAANHHDLQRQLYWKAMMKAQASGDATLARRIASEFPEEEQRRYMLAHIEREQAAQSADAGKLAAIQQELSRLSNNEERINFLFYRASQISRSDRKAALGLLSQVGQMIDSTKSARSQLRAQIALAVSYAHLKSDRGFAIMESLIPRFNELVAASATLDGFGSDYLRDGEWNMSGEGDVGSLLNVVAENAGLFGLVDFDRAVNLAGQMERPELRLMAKLKIAQGVLTRPANAAIVFQRLNLY